MKTLLFVDDDRDIVAALVRQAEANGYRTLSAHNTFTALELIQRESPDLICMDVNMPTGNGLGIGELLVDLGRSDLPMIVLSGQSDQDTLRRCKNLGAPHVTKGAGRSAWSSVSPLIEELLGPVESNAAKSASLETPPATPKTPSPKTPPSSPTSVDQPAPQRDLIETVFEMLGVDPEFLFEDEQCNIKICGSLPSEESAAAPEPQASKSAPQEPIEQESAGEEWEESQPWVLCIEDDDDFSLALKLKLRARGISVVRANDGMLGLNHASTRPADAIILDFNLPNGQGDFVLRRLKSNPTTASIPVIVLTGVRDQNLGHKMMSLGASKFMNKPVVWEELFAELDRHLGWTPA